MPIGANWRLAARPASFAAPVAAVLLTGGGGPGLSQPMEAPRVVANLMAMPKAPAAVRPATVRIALPPPAAQPEQRPSATPRLAAIQPALPRPITEPAEDLSASALLAAGTGGEAALAQADSAGAPPRSSFEKLFGRPAYERPAALPKSAAEDGAALGRVRGPAELVAPIEPAATQALAEARVDPGETGIGRYRQTAEGLAFEVPAKVNGAAAGPVSLLIRDGDNISVRLTDLLKALEPQIDPALYEALSHSDAAQGYMTFNELRAAGIAVRFDRHDRLVLGAAPKG